MEKNKNNKCLCCKGICDCEYECSHNHNEDKFKGEESEK